MKFELDDFHRSVPDKVLLDDLKTAERTLRAKGKSLSFRSYNEVGKYNASTIAERFGSWNKALAMAGLKLRQERNVSAIELFDNLKAVWLEKGTQPKFRDMAKPPSRYSASVYLNRFRSWTAALKEFVAFVKSDEWIDGDDDTRVLQSPACEKSQISRQMKPRTGRDPSDRMRFRILLRDGFQCQSCGASPLKNRGVELHVDHILPWSEGGETVEENLQAKCKRCNQGKGNAFSQ